MLNNRTSDISLKCLYCCCILHVLNNRTSDISLKCLYCCCILHVLNNRTSDISLECLYFGMFRYEPNEQHQYELTTRWIKYNPFKYNHRSSCVLWSSVIKIMFLSWMFSSYFSIEWQFSAKLLNPVRNLKPLSTNGSLFIAKGQFSALFAHYYTFCGWFDLEVHFNFCNIIIIFYSYIKQYIKSTRSKCKGKNKCVKIVKVT